jgi:sugar phosphate isomerase/epimerase
VTTARPASALHWPDLCWSHFSRPRFGGFDERLAAAADAGFAAIGLYLHEYERLRDEEHRSDASLVAQFDAHGLCLGEVEAIRGWWALDGEERAAFDKAEALAFAMADGIGARYLQAIGPYECSFEQAADRFGTLCRRAAEHGLLVGVEWLPFTNIPDAASAQRLVEATGCDNAGYCADIWHHVRGANDEAMLRALPGDKIFAVQMNDGPLHPVMDDYKADCLATRLPPGEGEFDCAGFIRILRDLGVTAPISLEVASTELWQRPAAETARRAADGMRAVLATVDG